MLSESAPAPHWMPSASAVTRSSTDEGSSEDAESETPKEAS